MSAASIFIRTLSARVTKSVRRMPMPVPPARNRRRKRAAATNDAAVLRNGLPQRREAVLHWDEQTPPRRPGTRVLKRQSRDPRFSVNAKQQWQMLWLCLMPAYRLDFADV